jgi:hypothetical protein
MDKLADLLLVTVTGVDADVKPPPFLFMLEFKTNPITMI